ncbi:hypothetical protein ACQ4PT_056332 [Festuca glaucescens]
MAQLATGYPRFAPPPPMFSFRPPPLPLPLPPPPPSSYKAPSTDSSRARVPIVAGVLGGFFFLVLLFIINFECSMCRGQRNSRRARDAAAPAAARPLPLEETSSVPVVEDRPLRQACATSPMAGLPTFAYTLSRNMTGQGEEAAVTCSVCLGALQLGETVRLLPVCLHLYHAECIDPWLEAHSTCPICRSDTDTTVGVGRLPNV